MTTPTASHKEATVAGPWLDRRSPIVAVNAHQIANTVTNTNLSLRSILEKDKLTESNFSRLEAQSDDCTHAREKVVCPRKTSRRRPLQQKLLSLSGTLIESIPIYLLDVGYLMLATMSPDFRMRLINTNAYNMIRQLRDMSQTQARTERYDASRTLNACKMAKGTSVSDHENKEAH
ncbi:hypothetical protein OSB04_003205 [Centaurea solstitialis]|uniref:Uncharacterized protein n=1 Tax=Centaurea solstitialis TaxID=347529 RepID=A0AA38TUP4_9ASTR|nr:hypothetical protein OSB04_003205 [Centaurea solstitialis]